MPNDSENWRVIGASVPGHRDPNRICEDAHGYVQLPTALILVVADGAGSASHSAEGSRIAVREALRAAGQDLRDTWPTNAEDWEDLLKRIASDARAAIEFAAAHPDNQGAARSQGGGVQPMVSIDDRSGINSSSPAPGANVPQESTSIDHRGPEAPELASGDRADNGQASPPSLAHDSLEAGSRDFATTFIMAILSNDGVLATIHIGDGGIVAELKDRTALTVSGGWHGEYANETVFLTSKAWLRLAVTRVVPFDQASAIMLFTDGVQGMALDPPDRRPRAAFCAPLFEIARNVAVTDTQLAAFLASERVAARTNDDRTLVIATRV